MSDIYDFYDRLLSIKEEDLEPVIIKIINEEVTKIKESSTNLDGLCRVIGINIYENMKRKNINAVCLDLKELINIDHLILLVKYHFQGENITILVDPTFSQFVKKDNLELIKYTSWPSERILPQIKDGLLTKGCIKINNETFNNYVNSFLENKLDINLDEVFYDEKRKELYRHL